jgi:HD-GYP domain-containing protein (c-di-GMP phosphodiesterase class II)
MAASLISIPQEIADALEAIRESGECNMFDRQCVQAVASSMNEYATVVWLEDNKREYGRVIIDGFAIEENTNDQ